MPRNAVAHINKSFLCTFIMTSFGFRMESHLILFHFMFYPPFCCITFSFFFSFSGFFLFLLFLCLFSIFTFHTTWTFFLRRLGIYTAIANRVMGVLLPLHPPMSRRWPGIYYTAIDTLLILWGCSYLSILYTGIRQHLELDPRNWPQFHCFHFRPCFRHLLHSVLLTF